MSMSHTVSSKPGALFGSRFTPRFLCLAKKSSTGGSKRQGRSTVRVQAKSKAEEALQDVLQKGNGVLDTVVDFVPDNVPRPTAKIIAGIVGLTLTWWLIQKVLSTVVFFGVLGIAGFLFFQSQGGGGKGSTPLPDDDVDDPMATAKNIMDKYK
ncbi:hypothetical protein BSKO_07367 [Bryopsis sp. KO-2023]|nr:hypothetical protein BSKO_07367 [Bryopsis sp. KO-2023]